MKELKAIVRVDCVPHLVESLRKAGIDRFFVSRIHALGTGVDPEEFHLSFDEGESYMEKAKVELLCGLEQVEELLELIRSCAATGHRGDGVVIVSPVDEVVSVRTGERDRLALL